MSKRHWKYGSMIYGMALLVLLLVGCRTKETIVEPSGTLQQTASSKPTITPAAEQSSKPTSTPTPTKHPIVAAKEVLKDTTTLALNDMEDDFLSWLEDKYGQTVLLQVAKAITENTYSDKIWIDHTKMSLAVLKDEYKGILESEASQKEMWTYVMGEGRLSKDSVTLRFAGDISFSENKSTTLFMDKQKGGIRSCFSKDLLEVMESADLMMLNNEFTYSTRGEPLPNKAYTFRAKPSRVQLLHEIGVDLVSLANNHTYDYGEDALVDTLTTLEEAHIPFVGAGHNLEEAMKPVYYIMNGRKIAIVSATQIERSTLYTKQATETSPGVLRTKDPTLFLEVIKKAKANSDYVIAYVHWGTENVDYIDPTQRPLAQQFIDAGADVVIGGHTHCLQGFEFYKGKPILYSLGNFWFNSKTLDSGIMELNIDSKGEVQVFFLPCIQKGVKTSLVTSEKEKNRIIQYMENISYGVKIRADGLVTEK